MNEKYLIKKLVAEILITVAIALFVHICLDLTLGKTFADVGEANVDCTLKQEEIDLKIDTDDVIEVSRYYLEDGTLHLWVKGINPGEAVIEYSNKQTGEFYGSFFYKVTKSRLIVNEDTKNYPGCRQHMMVHILCLALICLWLWLCFRGALHHLKYSYLGIFCCGFSVWFTIIFLEFLRLYVIKGDMFTVAASLSSSEYTLMIVTFPIILIFSIALAISNIDLIRHERPKFRNLLGIILALILILGEIFPIAVNEICYSGSEKSMVILSSILNVYEAGYVLLECFMIGSVVCGTYAALHEPQYDKDYIIILGCKIRKDGTLYPLIQGRVDRAIDFYHKQLAATGKKAIFVPSGGQGSDETISEAEGMERYLLEKGFEKEQILVENQSKNTIENMRFSKKLIEERNPEARIAYSTTNFHVFRSGIISRQAGISPEGMGGKTKWYFWPNAYMRECLGMIVYTKKILIVLYILIAISFALAPVIVFYC